MICRLLVGISIVDDGFGAVLLHHHYSRRALLAAYWCQQVFSSLQKGDLYVVLPGGQVVAWNCFWSAVSLGHPLCGFKRVTCAFKRVTD